MTGVPTTDPIAQTRFRRVWEMPNCDTFSIPAIGSWVKWYLEKSRVSIDPFARNRRWATYTNDLNPNTAAECHLEARDFLRELLGRGIKADLIIFDPPYSPRQVSECYSALGLTPTMQDTQTGAKKRQCRELFRQLIAPGGVVLSFGWNTVGMGPGWLTEEVLLVCHGGDHNDTICMADRLNSDQAELFA